MGFFDWLKPKKHNAPPPSPMPGSPTGGPPPIQLNPSTEPTTGIWAEGDRVLARWMDFFWYPATIFAVNKMDYHVLYDDGDQLIVPESYLMPLTVEEGEAIFARPRNMPTLTYAPAQVLSVDGEMMDVQFENGDEENLRISRARYWRCPVGHGSFAFEEGDRVISMDVDRFFYPAEIVSVDDIRIMVQFLDGPQRMVTPELISRWSLAVGTRVQGRWKAGPQYFKGVITQMTGDKIHIDYEDGDKEWSTVRLVRLEKLKASGRK